MKRQTIPDVMCNPGLLQAGDSWFHECGWPGCRVTTQGGYAGWAAHRLVVHRWVAS